MDYRIEVYDPEGRRVNVFTEVPLLEVTRTAPDQQDTIRGVLPDTVSSMGPGHSVKVYLEDTLFTGGPVVSFSPHWGDTRRLVLRQYVPFHEVMQFEAEQEARIGNTWVSRAYTNWNIAAIVKDVINTASGAIHYWVDHTVYPEGALREYNKFLARKNSGNELETGGISAGQWVGTSRIDLTSAYAKDGDTITGVKVDSVAWPDIRLMMIDTEELERNSHAQEMHPEVADWTDAQYLASGYRLKAVAARDALQALLDADGIDYIELNPHRDASGDYDDRVDAYGRYIALVYGGGKCYNAAQVEQGVTEVYLYQDGEYHEPEMALKDFYSYTGVYSDSIEEVVDTLSEFDVRAGVLEVLTTLAYAAGGHVFSIDPMLGVTFRKPACPDTVCFFDPKRMGVQWGSRSMGLGNYLLVSGNPVEDTLSRSYSRGDSIDEYGVHTRSLNYFSLSVAADADKLAEGLLDDLAYPERQGEAIFFEGESGLKVGDILEFRDGNLRRLDEELSDEWGGAFQGQLVGRVDRIRHVLAGGKTETQVSLTSPLRSVHSPLSFMVRSQESATTLFEFRLDDAVVGLDVGFHLD